MCVKVRILNRGWLFENVYVLVIYINLLSTVLSRFVYCFLVCCSASKDWFSVSVISFFYISNFISTFFLLLYFSSLYSQDLIYQSSLVRGNRKKTVQELFAFFRVDLYKFVWFCLAEVNHFLLCISSKKKQSQCVSSLNWLGFTSLALSILPESLARFFFHGFSPSYCLWLLWFFSISEQRRFRSNARD